MADWIGAPIGRMKFTAAHWYDKSEETQVIAESTTDPEARRALLEVASLYLKIAEHTEALAAAGVVVGSPPRGVGRRA